MERSGETHSSHWKMGKETSQRFILYCPHKHPRIRYTLAQVFEDWFGLVLEWAHDEQTYLKSPLPSVNYSKTRMKEQELFLPYSGWLDHTGCREEDPDWEASEGQLTRIFPQKTAEADVPVDFPALCFFFLSRYEEYRNTPRDLHGRFPASASFAYRTGTLSQPIVDRWAQAVSRKLVSRYPQLAVQAPQYRFEPTYDVDYAWAYLHKSPTVRLANLMRLASQGEWAAIQRRKAVLRGEILDPFDTFSYLHQLHLHYQLKAGFFFLLADRGRYDRNFPWYIAPMRTLVNQVGKENQIGIHPSYFANKASRLVKKEKERLENLIGQPIVRSRQHFIRLKLPETYRCLIDNLITDDYSMGFPEYPGFRAGTSRSFKWYDLEKEQTTNLSIHPFQVMDGALKNYLHLTPAQAQEQLKEIIDSTRQSGGTFRSLWHNSSFSTIGGWEAWKPVYEFLVHYASTQ